MSKMTVRFSNILSSLGNDICINYKGIIPLYNKCIYVTRWDEYVNGSSVFRQNITSIFGDHANTNAFYIGTRFSKDISFTGVISEVIVYNKVLTSTERQFNEGYLAWKYNINNQLPNTHPYYNNKPL
jgi:hypothetical protein